MIITENIDEYRYMLRHMCRFMKELGLYKAFTKTTINSYGSFEAHLEKINEYVSRSRMLSRGWEGFFCLIPYLGQRYNDYRMLPNLPSIAGEDDIISFMNYKWSKYLADNCIRSKFRRYKAKNKMKSAGLKKRRGEIKDTATLDLN